MRYFFFLLLLAISLQVQAQLDDSLPPYFKGEWMFEQISEQFTDLSPRQMSSIKASVYQVVRKGSAQPNPKQKIKIRRQIREAILENLNPQQVKQLKILRGKDKQGALISLTEKAT